MYEPGRKGPYYYLSDLILDIEENQCGTCVFRNDDPEMPMCYPVSGQIIIEEPVEELVELPNRRVICIKHKPGDPTPPQVEGQETLF